MSVSLCGDSFGCLTENGEGTVGTNWSWDGQLVPCGQCRDIALKVVTFLVGEPIEFFVGTWRTSRNVERVLAVLRGEEVKN